MPIRFRLAQGVYVALLSISIGAAATGGGSQGADVTERAAGDAGSARTEAPTEPASPARPTADATAEVDANAPDAEAPYHPIVFVHG